MNSRSSLRIVLVIALVFNGLFLPRLPMTVQAQHRVIVINAEQPNVWTLEQAHYLLAQMHRRNLDLRTKNLEELDPNEIAGLRFDVLRSLVEVGVSFDDANRVTNRMLLRDRNFNTARREELISRRDRHRDESLELTRNISNLQTSKAVATTQEEKDRIDAEIAAKTTLRDQVDKEVELDDKELGTLTATSGDLQKTEANAEFDASKFPESVFDDAFKKAAGTMIDRFSEEPRLNASLRLENFLQMQYEIIAKQLTLLRDEVGPGERLLFLELPQTVNVTQHEGDNKWAQSWWRIAGYTRNVDAYANQLPETLSESYRAQMRRGIGNTPEVTETQREQRRNERFYRNDAPQPTSQKVEKLLSIISTADPNQRVSSTSDNIQYVNLDSKQSPAMRMMNGNKERLVPLNERVVRTIELIPRQSSLNVNDMKLQTHSGALSAVASFLWGFGASLNVQRQREQFSQFVQQELYSSAFGKGSREFGWTFTPMPGTDRLLSGSRTTYAVVVVPDEATSLVLETNGCYFPKSAYQPLDFNDTVKESWSVDRRTSRNCGEAKAFLVPIPVGGRGNNDFRIDAVFYKPVDKGERIVVSMYGYNFSAQTGVLVNGSPLSQSIGLAQPFIRDDSITGEKTAEDLKGEKVHGRIERIDSEEIVVSFEMPPDFTGTPTITLVAPGKAIDINRLTLHINSYKNTSTLDNKNTEPMFNVDPDPKVKIDGLEVFRSADGRSLTALVTGKGFDNNKHRAYINGTEISLKNPNVFVSPTLLRGEIPVPPDENIQAVLTTGDRTIKSKPVANPGHLQVTNVTVVTYEPASRQSPVAVLVVKLEGSGFSRWLKSSVGNLTPVSSSEALLSIDNPGEVTPVVLRDEQTGATTTTVVTRSHVQH